MSVAEVNKPQPPDFELAKRAADGDGSAFEELYRRHYRRVYALTLRMMGNPTEAEDMTQDVFLQLFNKIGMFRGESVQTHLRFERRRSRVFGRPRGVKPD